LCGSACRTIVVNDIASPASFLISQPIDYGIAQHSQCDVFIAKASGAAVNKIIFRTVAPGNVGATLAGSGIIVCMYEIIACIFCTGVGQLTEKHSGEDESYELQVNCFCKNSIYRF
jgi:hypothetical protein